MEGWQMSKFAYQEILKNLRQLSEKEDVTGNGKRILCNNLEKLEKYTDRLSRIDQQEALSRPFSQGIIKHREGQKKKQLAYVETVHYIDRLNEAFGYTWNWEIISENVTEHEAYCKGRLTVEIEGQTVIKEAYGGKDMTMVDTYDKQTRQVTGKKPFSIADDLKSASSDALKKASSLLGIGLHLYKGNGTVTRPAPVASRQ